MPRVSRPFAAQYDGSCVLDFDFISEGDEIVMTDDGAAHKECAEAAGLISDVQKPREGEVHDFFD